MINTPKVIDIVVKNDLCIGCGLCTYKCPSNALKMRWNDYGFLIPELTGNCDSKEDCLSICPFNPFPKEDVKTENELAEIYLNETTNFQKEIGKYNSIYAGYAKEFRLTSSSGGIVTYIFTELLKRGIVDHVFSVQESAIPGVHYVYTISSSKEELLAASKTKYFPVTLGTIFPKIHDVKGKVAIVGVACFIKAVRLAQHSKPDLKEKIPFLVGIICGGIKSRFFTEYLAGKVGVTLDHVQKPHFRIKDLNAAAFDYSFGCYDESSNKEKTIKMRSVGDMWGTGFFKANACDFCDDVASELADISLGDAWIPPFNNDGHGTNVIVTRSLVAEYLIHEGIKNGKLYIEQLSLERFTASQQGSFNHRQSGLSIRLSLACRNIDLIC
jgi:coenzyme F420-reducing hydrogenase beta subunit